MKPNTNITYKEFKETAIYKSAVCQGIGMTEEEYRELVLEV